jgi:hypothetical protein
MKIGKFLTIVFFPSSEDAARKRVREKNSIAMAPGSNCTIPL